MKTHVFTENQLHPELWNELREMPMTVPFRVSASIEGYAISSTESTRFLRRHGLTVELKPTSYDGVLLVSKLKPATPEASTAPSSTPPTQVVMSLGKVRVQSWDGGGDGKKNFTRAVEEILLPLINGSDVNIYVPHGNSASPISDGEFHIHIWSGQNTESDRTRIQGRAPDTIFGIPTSCKDAGFSRSDVPDHVITDSSTGYDVGEIIGNNLFIFYDICHHGNDNEVLLFRTILELTVDLMGLKVTVDAEAAAEEEKKKKRMRTLFTKAHENMKFTCKRNIEEQRAYVSQYQTKLITAIRGAKDAEERYNALVDRDNAVEKFFEEEFERIMSVPKVLNVDVSGSNVVIDTDTLCCIDPRTNFVHHIGQFKITIPLDGSANIRWKNITQKVSKTGMGDYGQAPHIKNTGEACMGNASQLFAPLLAQYRVAEAALVAISFVESVNVDDGAGKYISDWPKADKDMIARWIESGKPKPKPSDKVEEAKAAEASPKKVASSKPRKKRAPRASKPKTVKATSPRSEEEALGVVV